MNGAHQDREKIDDSWRQKIVSHFNLGAPVAILCEAANHLFAAAIRGSLD
jgi:hypothetical protein